MEIIDTLNDIIDVVKHAMKGVDIKIKSDFSEVHVN